MDNYYKFFVVTLVGILALSSCVLIKDNVAAQTDTAAAKLQAADSAIGQAFHSVLEAEKAGGNVAQLIVKLNNAGALLAEAQNAYNSGNSTNVSSLAESVQQIANQVNLQALNLRDASIVKSQNNLLLTVSFSVIGAVLFGLCLLFVWRRFKRGFIKKLLDAKPELIEAVSTQLFWRLMIF
jgi:hypothetical protein